MDSPQKEKKGLIWNLLETASDTNVNVYKTVLKSLIEVGIQYPVLVLSSIRAFLDDPQTTPKAHVQSILYNAAESIIREDSGHLHEPDLEIWIGSSVDLLLLPTVALDLQQAAGNFIVALGCCSHYVDKVMNSLIILLKTHQVPPQSIIDTLAALASSNSRYAANYFNEIMDNFIPSLVNIKQDNYKIAVSSMFAKFSEAVVDAVANKGSTEKINLETHFENCSQIFDMFTLTWLRNTNLNVKNEVIFCLGHMSYLLPPDKLENHAGIVVTSIIGHYNYKRNPFPYTLTSSLALICDSSLNDNITDCIKPHLEPVLSTLFNQVCIVPNYSEPMTVKNHCEVLRCYEILCKSFSDFIMAQIIQRLENASHVQRVGALLVVKHLVNSHSLTGEKVDKIIFLLIPLLGDTNSKVVKSMAQVIVALCHNGHLKSGSGAPFILYLVQHSAGGSLVADRRTSLNEVGEEAAGDVCCRALNLLATSVSPAVPLLWPHLLQYVTNQEYQSSLPTILTCLAHLTSLPDTAPSDSKEAALLATGPTSSPFLLTRLLVLSCAPLNNSLGSAALSVLLGLAKHISPNLIEVWAEHLPHLKTKYSDLSKTSADPSEFQLWQDSLRDFFGCSIKAIDSEEFIDRLIKAQMEQLGAFDKNQVYRSFLMSLVGVSLKFSRNRAIIDSTLDHLYRLTNHKSSAEQESFSLVMGMCASSHMEIVLIHMDTWLKASDSNKRSLSLLSLLKSQDGRAEESVYVKCTILISLGQTAVLAPPEVVANHTDGPIMLHLLNIINSNKNDLVNDIVLQATSKIGKALLRLPGFRLRQRPLILTHVVNTIKQNNLSVATLANCLQVLRDMAALEPELNVEERSIVLQASMSSCLIHFQESLKYDGVVEKCYSQLNVLIRTIIQHDTNPATLDDVTTLLHSWTISPSEIVRTKSMDLLHSSFCTYLQHLELTHSGPTTFNQTCQLLSMLTPRCSDPCKHIRSQAVACLSLVLKIAGRYNGQGSEYSDDDLISLKALEDAIVDINLRDMGEPLILIAKVLCNKLTFVQLRLYLNMVVVGVQDLREEAAIGVAQILAAIFKLRGHQLHQHIKEILDSIYARVDKVTDIETRYHTIEAICNLSKHNITAVIDTIMNYSLPYDRSICETFQRLGCESDVCSATLTHLTHILERNQFFTEHRTACQDVVNIATLPTLTAICSMKELLTKLSINYNKADDLANTQKALKLSNELKFPDITDSQQAVTEKFASLAALLLVSYGSYIGTIAPLHQSSVESKNAFVPNRGAMMLIPSKCALECLQTLVSVVGCTRMVDYINTELRNLNSESMDEFLNSLSTSIALFVQEAPQHTSSLVAYLDTHHNHEMQRLTVTTVFGQLVAEKCCGDFELLEIITTGLLSRLNDKSVQVRRLAVRGLSNFARLQSKQVNDKMNEVVSALVGATDLREGSDAASECQVTLEALRGLSSALPSLQPNTALQHSPTLLIRIRLFVEKNNGDVREAAIGVLKGLAEAVGDSDEFKEHIHLHLLTCLIHLEDTYEPMVLMCKSALQCLGPHLGSEETDKYIQENLIPNSHLNFSVFIANFFKCMANDMADHLAVFLQATSSYFRHSEPCLRRAALLIVGNLIYYSKTPIEPSNLQRVSRGICSLLKDFVPTVRATAATVVPLLHKHDSVL